MEDAFATSSLGARIVALAKMAVAMHVSMELLSNQQAMIGGTDRCVTDDAQPFAAGERED